MRISQKKVSHQLKKNIFLEEEKLGENHIEGLFLYFNSYFIRGSF